MNTMFTNSITKVTIAHRREQKYSVPVNFLGVVIGLHHVACQTQRTTAGRPTGTIARPACASAVIALHPPEQA